MSVDPLPHPRTQAVMHLSSLLRDKPEQESNILRLLVNKLVSTVVDTSLCSPDIGLFARRATRTDRLRQRRRITFSRFSRRTRA